MQVNSHVSGRAGDESMRLFTETGAGPAPLSEVCGAVPDARNPAGERYTDVPGRGSESAGATAATATGAGPPSARRWAASSDVTGGAAGAWYGCRLRERGLSTAYTLYSPSS